MFLPPKLPENKKERKNTKYFIHFNLKKVYCINQIDWRIH